jgi:hypothetical protein
VEQKYGSARKKEKGLKRKGGEGEGKRKEEKEEKRGGRDNILHL